MLPFNRFPGVDTRLGPEMRSTGEVMGIDADFGVAFAKSQAGTGQMVLPTKGTVFCSVANRDKRAMIFPIKRLAQLGFSVLATEGTAETLRRAGVRGRGRAQAQRPGRGTHDRRPDQPRARATSCSTPRPAAAPAPTATRSAPPR